MNRSVPVFYVLVQPEGAPEASRVDLTDRVLSFEYVDSEAKADVLKLTVDNWDLSNFDDPVWKPGNLLLVSWGYVGKTVPTRSCVIQKVSGSTQITVEAHAKTTLMNKVARTRTFTNKTRSEVVEQIAKENGFVDAEARDIEATTKRFDTIAQSALTDAQMIRRLAQQEGKEFYCDHSGLHWHMRRVGQRPARVVQWYLPPDVGDIISFNVESDIFAKPAKVVAQVRDPLNKKEETVTASQETPATTLAPEALLISQYGEVQGVTTDMAVMASIDYSSQQSSSSQNVSIDPSLATSQNVASSEVVSTTEVDVEVAKTEVTGRYLKTTRAAVKLSMELVGDPGIYAKSILEVRGISKRLSGKYFVNEATHKISTSGYTISLKCTSDGTNSYPADLLGATDVPKQAPVAPAQDGDDTPAPTTGATQNTQEPVKDKDALQPVTLISQYGEGETTQYVPPETTTLTSEPEPSTSSSSQ